MEGALAPPPAPNKNSFLQTLVVDARAVKVLGGGPVGRPCCTGWPQRRSQRSAPSPAGWRLPTGASAPVVGAPGRRGEGGVAARVAGPGASEQSAPLVRSAPGDLATASLRILVTMPLTGLLQRVVATCTFTFLPPANEKIQGYYRRTRVMSSDFIKENIYFVGPLLVQSVYLAFSESVRDDIFWLPLEVIGVFVPYYTVRGLFSKSSFWHSTKCGNRFAMVTTTKSFPGGASIDRLVALPHTEGCRVGYPGAGERLYSRFLLVILTYASVSPALMQEHGRENSHNAWMREERQAKGSHASQYGFASERLDGGSEKSTAKARKWFTAQAGQRGGDASRLSMPLAGLPIVVVGGASSGGAAGLAAALLRAFDVDGSTAVAPTNAGMLRSAAFSDEVCCGRCSDRPLLAFAVAPAAPGLHITDVPAGVFGRVEVVSALVAVGIAAVVVVSSAAAVASAVPVAGSPMVSVLHVVVDDGVEDPRRAAAGVLRDDAHSLPRHAPGLLVLCGEDHSLPHYVPDPLVLRGDDHSPPHHVPDPLLLCGDDHSLPHRLPDLLLLRGDDHSLPHHVPDLLVLCGNDRSLQHRVPDLLVRRGDDHSLLHHVRDLLFLRDDDHPLPHHVPDRRADDEDPGPPEASGCRRGPRRKAAASKK